MLISVVLLTSSVFNTFPCISVIVIMALMAFSNSIVKISFTGLGYTLTPFMVISAQESTKLCAAVVSEQPNWFVAITA